MLAFQYCTLAVGIKPQFRGARCAVPCDRDGNELPYGSDYTEIAYWNDRVLDYYIKDGVLFCRLDVDPT